MKYNNGDTKFKQWRHIIPMGKENGFILLFNLWIHEKYYSIRLNNLA